MFSSRTHARLSPASRQCSAGMCMGWAFAVQQQNAAPVEERMGLDKAFSFLAGCLLLATRVGSAMPAPSHQTQPRRAQSVPTGPH